MISKIIIQKNDIVKFVNEEVLGNYNFFDVLNFRQFYDRGIKKKYNFIIIKIFFVYLSFF